jgi:tetratricopeptide (TPR) repeat protein
LQACAGRWDEAARRFASAHERRDASPRLLLNLAHARIEGLGQDASSVWRTLGRPRGWCLPPPYDAYLAAWSALRGGEPDAAVAVLEALAAAPRFRLFGQLALARFLEADGRLERAAQARHALARQHPLFDAQAKPPMAVFWNPLLADAHRLVARHAQSRGYWSRARREIEAAFRIDPQADRLELALADLARASGAEEEVLLHLSQALQERPRSARVRFALGLEYAQQGYLVEASGQLEAAWRLPSWPGREALRHGMGEAAAAAGAQARRNFRRALRLNGDGAIEVRGGYLCLLLGLGRFREALRQTEILDKDGRESADLLLCRGEAFAGLGFPGEAARCVTRALRLGGSHRIARALLTLVCRARAGIPESCPAEGS